MCLCIAMSIQGLDFGVFGYVAHSFQSFWLKAGTGADFGTGCCTSVILASSAPSFVRLQAEFGHFGYPDPLLSLNS